MDKVTVKTVERLLQEECSVYESYLRILDEERSLVTKLDSKGVTVCAEKREELSQRMIQIRDKRTELIKPYRNDRITSLTDVIRKHCGPVDSKVLLSLTSRLRELVKATQRRSRELAQIVNFSLDMVNGSMSILWSATQSVTRSYGANGLIKESYQSQLGKDGVVTRQA